MSRNNSASGSVHHRAPIFPLSPTIVLPTELYQTLNYVHLLHSLALNPSSVLPPGKSLLSVLSRPYSQGAGQNSDLRKRVETLVHKAFWDNILESLSDPTPAVQLSRLKELLKDIRIAVEPLLPEKHPVLTTLSLPLPPTSNVLHSVLDPLRDVLRALRSRCAPIHDQQIDHLIISIEDPLDVNLPHIIVDVSRETLELCEQMKEDLSQFVLGTMEESQLHEAVVQEAIIQERQFIEKLWGIHKIRELWNAWLDATPSSASPSDERTDTPHRTLSKAQFIRCLIRALGTNQAVSCPLPSVTVPIDASSTHTTQTEGLPTPNSSNSLPPPLLFETPTLLYLQNFLQALVITASLRALVRLPPPSHTNNIPDTPERDFEERVWLLLKDDIDHEPSGDGTKLINLADEVVRVSCTHKGDAIDATEEARLRTAVDRTLQPNDPVFMLLQKRLLQAIQARLLGAGETSSEWREASPVPRHLQSGRRVPGVPARPLSRNRLSRASKGEDERTEDVAKLVVKGFEHPVVVSAVNEALAMIEGCVGWTERVWGEVLFAERH